jgi:hypothetical protein
MGKRELRNDPALKAAQAELAAVEGWIKENPHDMTAYGAAARAREAEMAARREWYERNNS